MHGHVRTLTQSVNIQRGHLGVNVQRGHFRRATMSPKINLAKGQLPDAMQVLFDKLKQEPTADAIKHADYETRKKAFSAMNHLLAKDKVKQAEYAELTDRKDQHEFMSKMMLEIKGNASASNTWTRTAEKNSDAIIEWLTEDEIADRLKSKANAAIAVKTLPDRVHELDGLAKAGVMQYRWVTKKEKLRKQDKRAAELTVSTELDEGETASAIALFEDPVAASTSASSNKKPKKGKIEPTKEETEQKEKDDKERKKMQSNRRKPTNRKETLKYSMTV